jgi:hypothetical protein
MRWLAAACLLLSVLATDVGAQQSADVAIVLAVDASSSVNFGEFDLQMRGIAESFRSPEVQRAVKAGPSGAVAITVVQWSGPLQVQQVLPWRLITDPESAEALAKEVETTPRFFTVGSTAIGQALTYSASMFEKLPWSAGRRVIDLSGDGANTDNPPVEPAREAVLKLGITINGLPIQAQEVDIDVYYRDKVIGGHGAFVEVAKDYEAFKEAMTRKLIREIRTEPLISWLDEG